MASSSGGGGSRVRKISTTNQFDRILNGSNSPKKLVVVDFNADWCGPCKKISPVFEKLSNDYPRAVFLSVNCDECKELAQSKAVKALPTFMFFRGIEKLDDETFTGADAAKLEEKIKRLNTQISPFAGQGHSLTSSSSSSAQPQASSGGGGRTGGGGGGGGGAPRRFNPWANPNFKPPGSGAAEAQKKPKEDAVKQKPDPQRRANNPWSNPEYKPAVVKAPAAKPSGGNEMEVDDELSRALKMSMEENTNASSSSSSAQPSGAAASGGGGGGDAMDTSPDGAQQQQDGNDPQLLKNVNSNLVQQLIAMGFPKLRAEKSLILTGGQNAERAMEWLLQHENDADVDEPLKVVGSAPKPKEEENVKVWKPNERGAPLGWKAGVEYVDSDDEDPHASALMKRLKAKDKKKEMMAADPNAKPLTKEEKLAHLQEKREKTRAQKIKEEREAKRAREKTRQQNAKEAIELKRAKEEREKRMLVERKKREKQKEKDRKKRIQQKIKADKLRRKKEAEERKRRAAAAKQS